jgi:hypothetical protein
MELELDTSIDFSRLEYIFVLDAATVENAEEAGEAANTVEGTVENEQNID